MTLIKNLTKRLTLASVKGYLNTLSTVSPEKGGEKAFKVFSKPRKGRLTPTNKVFLNTAIWEMIETEQFKIQTYRWAVDNGQRTTDIGQLTTDNGQRATILLAHGWESNSARWKPLLAKLLKEGHTVIALDAPAHGATSGKLFVPIEYAACINKVIERFQPSILLGHSVGGYASAYCMAHFIPPSVKKLILMATPSNMTQIFDAFLDFLKLSPNTRQAFYDYIKTTYGKPAEAFALEHFADKIQAKGLIIHDENDELIGHKDAFTIEKAWKNTDVIITKGLGHRLRHDKIYKMILDFIR
jgi:pimeloyl-ACP methyl ester carboxylesterase